MSRQRSSGLAGAILLLVVVCTAALEFQGSYRLAQVLDENWRGAYDILVRPPGDSLDTSSTDGYVEGNFVGVSGAGGISLAQLDHIRSISGVQLAAPIGLIGQVGYDRAATVLDIPDVLGGESVLSTDPALYRLTYNLSLTDAGGRRLVSSEQIRTVLRRQSDNPSELIQASDNNAATTSTPEVGTSFTGPTLPAFTSSVIAVDPTAEFELLGSRRGEFLKPLTSVPSDRAVKDIVSDENWLKTVDPRYAWSIFSLRSAAESQPDTDVVPLVVNTTPGARLDMSVVIEKSPKSFDAMPESVPEVRLAAQGARYAPVGSTHTDLTGLLVPFATGNLEVAWPGRSRFTEDQRYLMATPSVNPVLVGRPSYQRHIGLPEGRVPSFALIPRGAIGIDGQPLAGGATSIAGVQSYRTAHPIDGAADVLSPPAVLPIASFSLADLDFGSNQVSYVPFGAYDPATTSLVADASGGAVSPKPIVANPSGIDFISGPPGAITDLKGAVALRGEAPIDAVRVRVADVGAYTPENVQKVVDIAHQIALLGLSVSVVAGASPQRVNVFVPKYLVGNDLRESDLGWVRQDWTTLGAAPVVQGALSELSVLLVALAMAVAGTCSLACVIAARRRRATEAALLQLLGWRTGRILRWHMAPHALVLGVIAAASVALAAADGSTVTGQASLAAVGITVAGLLFVPARPERQRKSRRLIRSAASSRLTPVRLAVRQLVHRPSVLLARVLSWSAVGGGAAAILIVVEQAKQRAGATRLAGLAADRTAVGHLSLAVLTLAAGLLFVILSRRIEVEIQRGTVAALELAGWSRPDLFRRSATVIGAAVVPSLLCSAALAMTIAAAAGEKPALPVLVGLSTAVICAAVNLVLDLARTARG